MFVRVPRILYLVFGVLVFGIALTGLNVWQLQRMQREHFSLNHGVGLQPSDYAYDVKVPRATRVEQRPIVWVSGKDVDSGYLDHVFRVFERFGFQRGSRNSRWNVLWHHDYPFLNEEMAPILESLEPDQKVNHVPGSGFYTSKVNLATSNISGIPVAFKLPDQRNELLKDAMRNKNKLWVQKSNKHREIVIKKISDMELSREESFVQEYISRPLLIDNRKFDIGQYTVITSVDPLRVYTYDGEALLRFCPEDYHPFDAANLNKYVVGDDYTPTWEIPSLRLLYKELSFTHKETLNAYLRRIGMDPSVIWIRIRETIRQVMRVTEPSFLNLVGKYRYGSRSFFELSRFDFVLDEFFNVYLMEVRFTRKKNFELANMSPNLSSQHFPPNKLLYEQVLFNLLSVTGVSDLRQQSSDELQMKVSDKDIQVYALLCSGSICSSCANIKCKTCNHCMSTEVRQIIRDSYLEHSNRKSMRRVIPEPLEMKDLSNDDEFIRSLSHLPTEMDKMLSWWFRGKCLTDSSWCN